MKNNINHFAYVLLVTLFLFSCQKKVSNINSKKNSLTQQIEKIETVYKDGDIKLEKIETSDYSKIETPASNELIAQIKAELAQSYSKQKKQTSTNLVGVFQYGASCGNYKKLTIYMDAEDDRASSSAFGNIGMSSVNSKRDIILNLCVVPSRQFRNNKNNYALINLGSITSGNNFIRHFDNEDNRNLNHTGTKFNKMPFKGRFGNNTIGKPNTTLSFLHFRASNLNLGFPRLNIPYGVLGNIGQNKGQIYSDDEDRKNTNSFSYIRNGKQLKFYNGITNLIDVGSNTRLYISQVKS